MGCLRSYQENQVAVVHLEENQELSAFSPFVHFLGQVVARCTVGGFEERYEVTRPLIVKAGEDEWVDVVVKVQSWSDVMNFHSRGRIRRQHCGWSTGNLTL